MVGWKAASQKVPPEVPVSELGEPTKVARAEVGAAWIICGQSLTGCGEPAGEGGEMGRPFKAREEGGGPALPASLGSRRGPACCPLRFLPSGSSRRRRRGCGERPAGRRKTERRRVPGMAQRGPHPSDGHSCGGRVGNFCLPSVGDRLRPSGPDQRRGGTLRAQLQREAPSGQRFAPAPARRVGPPIPAPWRGGGGEGRGRWGTGQLEPRPQSLTWRGAFKGLAGQAEPIQRAARQGPPSLRRRRWAGGGLRASSPWPSSSSSR